MLGATWYYPDRRIDDRFHDAVVRGAAGVDVILIREVGVRAVRRIVDRRRDRRDRLPRVVREVAFVFAAARIAASVCVVDGGVIGLRHLEQTMSASFAAGPNVA